MQEYDYPIGGPCGWMWVRQKEKTLTQDDNPDHLPAGSPNSTGGEFTTNANAGGGGKNNKAYLKDAIDPADDLFDFLPLPSTLGLKTLSVLKVLPSLSKETIGWLEKHFAEEEAEKALAGAETWIGKEGKDLSNFFEKKGVPQKPHVNKYADKSKANSDKIAEKARAERERLAQVTFRMPKVTRVLFDAYEKMGGHILRFHLNMSEKALVKRAKEKSASALNSIEDLLETYEKALRDPKNIEKIKNFLDGNGYGTEITVRMNRNIGRYVPKGAQKSEPAHIATFVLRKKVENGKTTFYPLTVLLTKGK